MVDTYRTEEEQIEAIKRWWKTDGLRTVGFLVLAACAYFGWQWWQQHSHAQALAASDVFAQLVEEDTQLFGQDASPKALSLVTELKTEHSGSYAHFAGLYAAKYAVERNDLSAAQAELEWVLAQQPIAEIKQLAGLRLARVLFGQNKYEAALSQLQFDDSEAWNMKKYDLQGDIYLAQNQLDAAKVAYEKALAYGQGSLTARFIELKLNSIPASVGSVNE